MKSINTDNFENTNNNVKKINRKSILKKNKNNVNFEDIEAYNENGYFQKVDHSIPIEPKDERDNDADTYIRRKILFGNKDNTDIENINRRELSKYRDDFFSFRNVVNQTSNDNDVDMVDKMNNTILSGGISKNFGGSKISTIYNALTDGTPKTNQHVLNPWFNNLYQANDAHNGKYLTDNIMRYSNDNLNNGGKPFFNDIYGDDGAYDMPQAVL
jgi:hypothetical protein